MAGLADHELLRQRWYSGKHVGTAKPNLTVLVRKVRMRRHFEYVTDDEVANFIPGTSPNTAYVGYLEVHSNFQELPNVKEIRFEQGFDQNGIQSATITMDNLFMEGKTGPEGLYHMIRRGYFSPFRGYRAPSLSAWQVDPRNEWYEVVREKSSQVVVLAGYGDARVPVFSGLIDDTDLTSRPDIITITARDFGQLLTDQRAFAWAKHPAVLDPITFADRGDGENVTQVGSAADASGWDGGCPPQSAVDGSDSTMWKSGGSGSPTAQPWVSMHVPNGWYSGVHISPYFPNLACYVSIYRHNAGQWIDNGNGYTNDGIPWVRYIPDIRMGMRGYSLGGEYLLGDNSVFRFTFTNLHEDLDGKQVVYRAGAREISAGRRLPTKEAKKNHWILVDDASDVVKTVLQWCGLRDWEVESTGVRLKDKIVFNRQTTFMEIVNKIAEMCNYVFFMKPPEDFSENAPDQEVNSTLGIPVFRSNQAMTGDPRERIEYIRDDQILTGIDTKFSDEPLAQHIRVRGKISKKGKTLDGDRSHRVQYGYLPPWSREDSVGNGGVKKVVVHYDDLLESVLECEVACLFIAFREALQANTAQLETPGFPLIPLDSQVALYDRGTGLATRMWVASRQHTISTGEDGEWKMSIGGSLIDVPDIVQLVFELSVILQVAGYNPWPLPHTFDHQQVPSSQAIHSFPSQV